MLKELVDFKNILIKRNGMSILENVNFRIHNAELCYITGYSGSGKSSLLKALYAAVPIEGDKAVVLDFDLKSIEAKKIPQLRSSLGLVFQDFKLFEKMTVYRNLDFFLESIKVKSKKERIKRVEEVLDAVQLSSKSNVKALKLSGGEKQRLAIARAIIHQPALILADEPTGNLNDELGTEIFELLRKLALNQGISVLVATHNQKIIQQFPSKTYLCHEGQFNLLQ